MGFDPSELTGWRSGDSQPLANGLVDKIDDFCFLFSVNWQPAPVRDDTVSIHYTASVLGLLLALLFIVTPTANISAADARLFQDLDGDGISDLESDFDFDGIPDRCERHGLLAPPHDDQGLAEVRSKIAKRPGTIKFILDSQRRV